MRVVALAVGTYCLTFPTGLVIELDDCYFVNINFISCLDKNGFSFIIKNNSCSNYWNDIFNGCAKLNNMLLIKFLSIT